MWLSRSSVILYNSSPHVAPLLSLLSEQSSQRSLLLSREGLLFISVHPFSMGNIAYFCLFSFWLSSSYSDAFGKAGGVYTNSLVHDLH